MAESNNNGTQFRQLRLARNLTLAQVADNHCSVAFLSKFERGERAISYTRLCHILDRINVPIEEFLYATRVPHPPLLSGMDQIFFDETSWLDLTAAYVEPLRTLIQAGEYLTSSSDPIALAHFQRTLAPLLTPNANSAQWQRFLGIMYGTYLEVRDINLHQNLQEHGYASVPTFIAALGQRIRPITAYLYTIDIWGAFELSILRIITPFLDSASLMRFTRLAVNRGFTQQAMPQVQALVSSLLAGAFSKFINDRHFKFARETLDMRTATAPKGDIDHAVATRFLTGWYQIYAGHPAQGQQTCQEVINLVTTLGLTDYAKMLQERLQMINNGATSPNSAAIYI